MIKSKEIFLNQTEPKIIELPNPSKYNCESMIIQIDNDTGFQLRISGKVNPKYPYEPLSVISSNYNIYNDITMSGIYNVSIGGISNIEIQLLSIDYGGKLNCFVNMF